MEKRTKHYENYALIIVLLLTACGQKSHPRDCSIRELLLNGTDLPAGSIVNEISSPIAEYPEESVGVTASYEKDLMFHLVGLYPSGKVSSKKFNQNLDLYFGKDDYGQSWEKPVGLYFNSTIADQYIAACGNNLGKYQCRMMGQYEDYYVLFFSYITEQGVDLETFQGLLQRLDKKMEQCLLR